MVLFTLSEVSFVVLVVIAIFPPIVTAVCICHAAKALELFLQDLCDRTYDITQKRGAKTMNSQHL